MAYSIGGLKVEVLKGDITKLEVDAVVNAANSYLTMGGGVAAAIKRAGGQEIEREAVAKGPIPIGEAVATTAGRLPARYVIHAPTMRVPGPTSPEAVSKATRAALHLADELGLSSLALPGMGTGVGRVPAREAARAMVQALKEHVAGGTGLKRVVLIDIGEEMVAAFREALEAEG
jgi:O-acetyl-ADP-ribose deacetylase (regulator of RNase III)